MERCFQAKSGKLESRKLNWNVALRQKWKVGKQKVELKRRSQAKVESWKAEVELERRSHLKVLSFLVRSRKRTLLSGKKWKVGKRKSRIGTSLSGKSGKLESKKVELERRFQAKVESWKAKVELERRSEGILERVFRAMSDAQHVNDACSVVNQALAPDSVKLPQESSKRRQTTTNSCKECENEISKSSRNQLCKTCYQRNYKRNKVNNLACETETILPADDDVDSRITPDIPCIEGNIEAPHLQKRRRSASEAVTAACSKAEETEM